MRGGPHFVIHPSLSQSPPHTHTKQGGARKENYRLDSNLAASSQGYTRGVLERGFLF